MSEEIKKPMENLNQQEDSKRNPELSREFQQVIYDQERKISAEDQKRKTLWAFDVLVQDQEVTGDTPYKDLLRIVRQRTSELRKTVAYAKYVKEGKVTEDAETELKNIADEEVKKAERLLGFFEQADRTLTWMNTADFDQDTRLGQIQDIFKNDLEKIEANITADEIKKRNESKQ